VSLGITKNQLLTLDNKKRYLVVETVFLDDEQYVYLVNEKDINDVKIATICYENNQIKIILVKDQKHVDAAAAFYNLLEKDLNT